MATQRPAILGGPAVRLGGEPSWPPRDEGTDAALRHLAESGDWGRYDGPHGDALRERLRQWHDVPFVHTCAGGTAAVELALRGVGVRPADEVALAAWDFKANFVNVTCLGATPVLVDVRGDDAQLEVTKVEAALSSKTRAVLVSHLHGGAVDMPALRDLCDAAGVAVVEDVCQMPLAVLHGRPAGTWGDVAAMSFGGSKTLSAGRGGAVLTGDGAIYQRIRLHTLRGNDVSPISEMQAALITPQIDRFEDRHAVRMTFASDLRGRLTGGGPLRPFPAGVGRPDYYKMGFFYDAAAAGGLSRDRFCEAMHAEGITLSPSFPALHLTHAAKRFRAAGPLENAGVAGETVVALHHPLMLEGEAGVDQFVAALTKITTHADELVAATHSTASPERQ